MIVRRWVFEDTTQMFRVMLSDEVVKHMFLLCGANRAQETGGILIGSYSRDCTTAQIIEATDPPADSKFGRDWFRRGIDGLKELLAARWNSQPRTHYVGEWHCHTANVPWPSPQDKRQMREVAFDRRYDCAQPLLIIVYPVRAGQWEINCFIFLAETLMELSMVDNPDLDSVEFDNDLV